MNYGIDGNQVYCTYPNFRDLQQDQAGFGDSLKEAFIELMKRKPVSTTNNLKSWEMKWFREYESSLRITKGG